MSSGRGTSELKSYRDRRRDRSESPPRKSESFRSSNRSPQRRRSPVEKRHDRVKNERRSRSRSQNRQAPSRDSERESRNPVSDSRQNRPSNQSSNKPINQPINQQNRSGNSANIPRRQNDVPQDWGSDRPMNEEEGTGKEEPKKDKPNFGLSGKLLEDTNSVNGVVISYAQPEEARLPKVRWRLYPFKGDETLPTMYIHRQSAYLLGRDRRVADIPLDHPSCSKQHAVIQFRLISVEKNEKSEKNQKNEKSEKSVVRRVKPYLIDLNSGNGTFVNGKKIESQRFVELLEKDVLKFGFSSREYVMLHEGSKDDEYHSEDEDRVEAEKKD